MGEQEDRERYNSERREAEEVPCPHGAAVCETCAYELATTRERERCAELVNWFRDREKTWGSKIEAWDQCRDAIVGGATPDGIRLAYPDPKPESTQKPSRKVLHAHCHGMACGETLCGCHCDHCEAINTF